jgi:DNA-binding MarR family transcriptional regulator
MATVIDQRLGYRIKQAQHALRGVVDAALRDEGLSMSQYATLAAISSAGVASNAELAARAFVTPQSAHEILRGLERLGLATRSGVQGRGRAAPITLTTQGGETLARADARVAAVEALVVDRLGLSESEHLSRLLLLAADALTDGPAPKGDVR